jgi:hypothetical protein
MGCSSCGKPKAFNKVKVTSSYTPKPNEVTKMTDVFLNLTIEKESNVSRQNKKNT